MQNKEILLVFIQEQAYYSMLKQLISKLKFGSCKTKVEKTNTDPKKEQS